jgi:hypothetical protein
MSWLAETNIKEEMDLEYVSHKLHLRPLLTRELESRV